MTSLADRTVSDPGPASPRRRARRRRGAARLVEVGWVGAAWATTLVVWLTAWSVDSRRYVLGDTTDAYYGWLYDYGRSLREGRWPLLSVLNMSAGNHVAEGQMGLYNPVSALIALGTTVAPNLIAYMVLVKFALGLVAVVGAYALVRSYGVGPPLAAVAATAMPLCGLSLTCEVPRWLTGQMCVAFLPWAWWLTRRAMRGAQLLPALVACALVVTVGYVYGTLYLICVLLGLLVEAAVARRWSAVRRGVLVGVVAGLMAVVVYLPGVLTLDVTLRNTGIGGGDGSFRIGRPWGYLLTGSLAGSAGIPLYYLTWYLPLFALVQWRRAAAAWRSLLSVLVPLAIMTAWSVGPYQLGPIRWPGRINDAYTLVIVLLLTVLLSRFRAPAGRGRLAVLLGVVVLCAAAGLAQRPHSERLYQLLAVVFLVVVLTVVWRLLDRPRAAGAVLIAVTALVGVFQVLHYPTVTAPQRNMPTELATYRTLLPGARGAVMVIDGTSAREQTSDPYTPDRARYLLTGSLWELTDKHVVNGYSTIGYKPYSLRYCTQVGGDNCPEIRDRLFEKVPGTGIDRVDALGISTLVVGTSPEHPRPRTPDGWHVVATNPYAITWVRDRPVALPGGVAWSSAGVEVQQVGASGDLGVSFRVDSVPTGGGDVLLSRLDWPGYRVQGGTLAGPLDQMFVHVHLDGDAAGSVVSVSYRPPGWRAEEAALALAALLGAGGLVLDLTTRRRRRSSGRPSSRLPGRARTAG